LQHSKAGVTDVPMFVIGGQTLTGLQDAETLAAVIDEEFAGDDHPASGR
jgi:predicted DsbA family dithiol-disulfide isomerase